MFYIFNLIKYFRHAPFEFNNTNIWRLILLSFKPTASPKSLGLMEVLAHSNAHVNQKQFLFSFGDDSDQCGL